MYSKGTVGGLPLRIITNRLEIIPYNRPQLEKAINDPSGAAQEIDAIYGTVPYEIERSKRKVYAMKLGIIDENPKAWLFATAWIIISRQSRLIVGEIGFKGLRANGEVGWIWHQAGQPLSGNNDRSHRGSLPLRL